MEPILVRVALYIQAVAGLEVALDDLLLLANARRKELEFSAGKFPVQISEKVRMLEVLCATERASPLPYDLSLQALTPPLELRNSLVHGAIIGVTRARDTYNLTLAKVSRPERLNGGQVVTRTQIDVSEESILDAAATIERARSEVDNLSKKIFWAGEGWPSYLYLPLADPLGLKRISERIAL